MFGAKTVNGPLPLSVSTNPPAATALTRVENSGVDCAASTIVGNFPSENRDLNFS